MLVPLPDLVFTRFDGTGLTVRNIGNVASGPFSVLVVSSFSFDFGPLQPGEEATRDFDFCVDGTIDGIIDPHDEVDELDEQNSASAQSVCLDLTQPDRRSARYLSESGYR